MMKQMYIKRYSNPNPGKVKDIAEVIEDEIMPKIKAAKPKNAKRKDGRTSYASKKMNLKSGKYCS